MFQPLSLRAAGTFSKEQCFQYEEGHVGHSAEARRQTLSAGIDGLAVIA
jgi:hypothetical protein